MVLTRVTTRLSPIDYILIHDYEAQISLKNTPLLKICKGVFSDQPFPATQGMRTTWPIVKA